MNVNRLWEEHPNRRLWHWIRSDGRTHRAVTATAAAYYSVVIVVVVAISVAVATVAANAKSNVVVTSTRADVYSKLIPISVRFFLKHLRIALPQPGFDNSSLFNAISSDVGLLSSTTNST